MTLEHNMPSSCHNLPLHVTILSDSMLKHLDLGFTDIHYVRGSDISMIVEMAEAHCKDTDLVIIKAGINNLLNGFSVANCMYEYKKAVLHIHKLYPSIHIAFMDVSYIAQDKFTGIDRSTEINVLVDELNYALHELCVMCDKLHFSDLGGQMNTNGNNKIDRMNLAYDGLHYSKQGTAIVAYALIQAIESIQVGIVQCTKTDPIFFADSLI